MIKQLDIPWVLFCSVIVLLFVIAYKLDERYAPKQNKLSSPITITINVQKPEQITPVMKELVKGLPSLEGYGVKK